MLWAKGLKFCMVLSYDLTSEIFLKKKNWTIPTPHYVAKLVAMAQNCYLHFDLPIRPTSLPPPKQI